MSVVSKVRVMLHICLCRECSVEGSCNVAYLCLCRECCVEGSCNVADLFVP